MFQCSKCCITFSSHEELKSHCRCKWHAYNLMRATQGWQPTSLQAFETLTQELLQHKQSLDERVTLSCPACNKTFLSEGTYNSHLQSRSHKTRQANLSPEPTTVQHDAELAAPHQSVGLGEAVWDTTRLGHPSDAVDDQSSSDSDGSWEELSDAEAEEEGVEDRKLWPCVLCSLLDTEASDTLWHMRDMHSFTVPHREACDPRSLCARLAHTVLRQRRCPQCGRQFQSVGAVRRHMTDKSHLSINPLSEQYRRCYRTDLLGGRLELPPTPSDACVFELTLSSGARITQRSLALFTKQRLRPAVAPQPRAGQRRLLALQQANRQASGALLAATAFRGSLHRQQVAESRRRAPERLALATRANALRHRIRVQVDRAG